MGNSRRVTANPAFKKGLAIGVVLLSLAGLYGPSLQTHVRQSGEYYTDDATQHVAPFLRQLSGQPRDYIERYWMANLPPGYKAVYRGGGLFTSPRVVSRWLPYPLLVITVLLLAVAAHRFGGLPAALAVAVLALSADIFLSQMAGGLTRAFAFLLFAGTAADWAGPTASTTTWGLSRRRRAMPPWPSKTREGPGFRQPGRSFPGARPGPYSSGS
jgi:hypothetical protein